MGRDLDQALRLVNSLQPNERHEVLQRLKAGQQFAPKTNGHINSADASPPAVNGMRFCPELDWLLEGVYNELRRRGLLGPEARVPLTQIKRFAPNWTTQSEAMRALLIKRMGKGTQRANVKIALGRVVAQALADYLGTVAPIGLKVLLTNIDKLPQAIDEAFPGYMAAGMLRYLVDSSSFRVEG